MRFALVDQRQHRTAQRLGTTDRLVAQTSLLTNAFVISFTVLSEFTAQCETSSERAPA